MEAVNDSLRRVAKSRELIRSYLDLNDIDKEPLLELALELLEKTVDSLSAV